jgi:hypothetical protein
MEDFMKTIMIIALLLVAISASAEWLETEFSFQAGWIPDGNVTFYTPSIYRIELGQPFDITLSLDSRLFTFIRIGGKCITLFSFHPIEGDTLNFFPTGMNYIVFFGIEPIKGISIIYEHSCFHPVMPYFPQNKGYPSLDGSYGRLYLEINATLSF